MTSDRRDKGSHRIPIKFTDADDEIRSAESKSDDMAREDPDYEGEEIDLTDEGLTDAGLKIRTMRLPDTFQDHDKPERQYDEARLNAPHIVETVLKALRVNSAGVEEVRA